VGDEHFNKLTPAQDERLAVLTEEVGELLQAIGKIQRHGYDSHDPTKANHPGNRRDLEKECGDVMEAIQRLIAACDVDEDHIQRRIAKRRELVEQYLHHQETDRG
jgi:NTP pyrophosphatase (non-canonical NTP hydrolase)